MCNNNTIDFQLLQKFTDPTLNLSQISSIISKLPYCRTVHQLHPQLQAFPEQHLSRSEYLFTSLIACHFCIRACFTGNSSTSSQNYDFWFPHHLHLPQYHFSKRIYETISVNTQPTAQTVSIGLAHNIFHHILYF